MHTNFVFTKYFSMYQKLIPKEVSPYSEKRSNAAAASVIKLTLQVYTAKAGSLINIKTDSFIEICVIKMLKQTILNRRFF